MNFLLLKLVMFHKGTILVQIKFLFMLSVFVSPFAWLAAKLGDWQMQNPDYVQFVIGAIAIDHILGSVYHAFYLRDFSIKKNLTGLLLKLLIVVSVGYLFEGLDNLMVTDSVLKDYTVMIMRLMVFLYPAGSAFANSYEMTGRKFPPVGFMDKLKQFSESTTLNKDENSKGV